MMAATSAPVSSSLSSSSALSVPASLTSPISQPLLPPPPSAVSTLSSSSSSIAPHALDPQYLALEKIWREKVRAKNCACKLMTREEVERIIQILEGILNPKNFNEKVKIKKFSVAVNEAGQRYLNRNAERGRKGVQYPTRIVVACEDLFELLKLHHDGTSSLNLRHVGFQKTVHCLRENYYGLDDDVVRAYIQNCALCKLTPPSGAKDSVKNETQNVLPDPGVVNTALAPLSLTAPSTFSLPYSVPISGSSQASGLSGIPAFLASPSTTIQPSNATLASTSASSGSGSAPCCLNCTSACAGWTHHFSATSVTPTFEDFRRRFSQFSCIRNWHQYHTPRNLLLALTGEIGELSELFQWRTDAEAGPMLPGFTLAERDQVAEELSDIALYLIRLADRCGVDLPSAMERKMEKNARKYPAEIVFGSHAKYTAYQQRQQQPGRMRKRKTEDDVKGPEEGEENAQMENGVGVAGDDKMKMTKKPGRKQDTTGIAPNDESKGAQDAHLVGDTEEDEDDDMEMDEDEEDEQEEEEAKSADAGMVSADAVLPSDDAKQRAKRQKV